MEFHLVSHTHWDREWYHTAEEFRVRLVDLIDELILDPPGEGQAFLLDGQAIVLEDYLDVRPSQRERLRGLLQAGRLEAGPWYVLADELIPGAEALVRNLLVGRHAVDSLGATTPPVLYCPDSFGHPAALPELAEGFGLPLIILWRGCGGRRWPSGDAFRWRAPSGREAIVFHLPPDGYEFGSSLPTAPDESHRRWAKIREVLASRSTTGVSLIQNGADHHARQSDLPLAVALLAERANASGDRLEVSSLRRFAEALLSRARAQRPPTVSGELRDSYGYTWTLQGTFGTRARQKRANAMAERALLRAESWSAAAMLAGRGARVEQLRAAWKTLLAAHPHDTLCGTSIDPVAEAMDIRVSSARRQAALIGRSAIETLLGHDPAAAREYPGEKHDLFVITNPAAHERGGVVLVEVLEKLADEPVGPGSAGGPDAVEVARHAKRRIASRGTQLIATRIGRHRIESARHYPDNDIVRSDIIACHVTSRPGVSVSVVDSLESGRPNSPVISEARALSTGTLQVMLAKGGGVSIRNGDLVLSDVVRLEDRADRGDVYTPSIGDTVARPKLVRQRLVHRGPLVGELRQDWALQRSGGKRGMPVSSIEVAMRLTADSPLVEFGISGVNRMKAHRLRLGLATGLHKATVIADAAFGPVERKHLEVPDEDRTAEVPPSTAPLHRYVSLYSPAGGLTIHSDGLAEYEVDEAGVVWITLVRAVGELSRNDLPERPGHAGWPARTPGAQSLGRFGARVALQAHGPLTPATLHAVERESSRFLHPLRGFTIRSATTTTPLGGGIELSGIALAASTIKESEDARSVVLRCVNVSDREQPGSWSLSPAVESARLARLDETPGQSLEVRVQGGRSVIPFIAGPRSVVTIIVTPRRTSGALA